MNEHELLKRKQELQALLEKAKATILSLEIKLEQLKMQECGLRGAIEDCDYWLAKIKPEEKKEEVKK